MNDQDVSLQSNTNAQAEKADKGLLAFGGLGAAIASACCILPFVLVMLGLGGAWMASLHALYPYRWLFIGAAAVALFFAWRRLYRPRTSCVEGELCAVPTVRRAYRVMFWIITALVAFSAVAPYLFAAILN